MPGKTRKMKADRKGPSNSATAFPEGTIKVGNDGHMWVTKKTSSGSPRWVPTISAELNGFKRLTVDYAAKHIGKPITLYCSEYKDMWPKKNDWLKKPDPTYYTMKFVPNGDAIKGKTKIEGWLRTQKPAVKNGDSFTIDGPTYMCPTPKCSDYLADGLQINSSDGQTLSPNLMNTVCYVKA
jgi:hypothetical protein